MSLIDFASSGLTIQYAILDQAKRSPKNERPEYILWAGLRIRTADSFSVAEDGVVRGEFLSSRGDIEQAFDLKVDGWLRLRDGQKVSLLRTWNGSRHEPVVEYPFHSRDRRLRVWNAYKMKYPSGQVVEEKWTGNAGFWIENISERERVYHCSHGAASPPDFEALVFKITILDREEGVSSR
ncbi:MAG: hypothetical protein ACXWFS_05965 [Thermoanaerobaculia bacterium]